MLFSCSSSPAKNYYNLDFLDIFVLFSTLCFFLSRCKRKIKMKRSKSLSPEPSSSEAKRVKLKVTDVNDVTSPNILEFSDDVLLYILKYLDPQDLMTLSL